MYKCSHCDTSFAHSEFVVGVETLAIMDANGDAVYIDPEALRVIDDCPAVCRRCGMRTMKLSDWWIEDRIGTIKE